MARNVLRPICSVAIVIMLSVLPVLGPVQGLTGGKNISLSAVTTTFVGEDYGDRVGFSVAMAGDVNGDGYGDVIVGAPTFDNAYQDEGEIFVWYGSSSGLGAAGTPTNVDWFAESLQESAQLGNSVGTAGDVNADGYSDVIAGAQYYDGTLANEGAAFIWTGSATGPEGDASPHNAAWVVRGGQAGSRFGFSAATAGDVDGDGYSDVIVGAPYYDGGETDEGRVFLYLGGASGVAKDPVLYKEINQANAHAGWVVGTAGDGNGDGYADIFYTAPDYDGGLTDEGAILAFYGPVEGIATGGYFIRQGELTGARLGLSAGCAGDVNGDGFAELVSGAPYYDTGLTDVGEFYLHVGGYALGVNRAVWPHQYCVDVTVPIAFLGRSDNVDRFRPAARGFTPFGRSVVKFECEVKPPAVPFDGTGTVQQSYWQDTGLGGTIVVQICTGLVSGRAYHWRGRMRYSPSRCPYQVAGRWFSVPWNGWNEARVRMDPSLLDVAETPAAHIAVSLAPPAPNPFASATTIHFTLPRAMAASLRVYDASGRLVRELLNTRSAAAGSHAVEWNGLDKVGRPTAPGVYFARLVTPGGSRSTRVVRTGG